jgi:hypothetical protein
VRRGGFVYKKVILEDKLASSAVGIELFEKNGEIYTNIENKVIFLSDFYHKYSDIFKIIVNYLRNVLHYNYKLNDYELLKKFASDYLYKNVTPLDFLVSVENKKVVRTSES